MGYGVGFCMRMFSGKLGEWLGKRGWVVFVVGGIGIVVGLVGYGGL